MPNARYYLFAEPGRFLPSMIRARMAVMVFTRHETPLIRFTSLQAFLLERTELPPKVFTKHETRNTAFPPVLPASFITVPNARYYLFAAPGRFLPSMIGARMAVRVSRGTAFALHQPSDISIRANRAPRRRFSRDTRHETRNTAFPPVLPTGFIAMSNGRYYLFAAAGG